MSWRVPPVPLDAVALSGPGPHGVVLEADELAVRFLEMATSEPRPAGLTAAEIVDSYGCDSTVIGPHLLQAHAAVVYLAELLVQIKASRQRQAEAALRLPVKAARRSSGSR